MNLNRADDHDALRDRTLARIDGEPDPIPTAR